MKHKAKIKEELDKAWSSYNEDVLKFVDSGYKDIATYITCLKTFGKIEALHWVLEDSEEGGEYETVT